MHSPLGTCEASWFDSISNRTSDSRLDSYWWSDSKFLNRLRCQLSFVKKRLVVVKFAFKVDFGSKISVQQHCFARFMTELKETSTQPVQSSVVHTSSSQIQNPDGLQAVLRLVWYTADSIRRFDSKTNRTADSIRDSIRTEKNDSQVLTLLSCAGHICTWILPSQEIMLTLLSILFLTDICFLISFWLLCTSPYEATLSAALRPSRASNFLEIVKPQKLQF